MDDRRVVGHPARVRGGPRAAALGLQLLVGLFVAHEVWSAERFEGAGHAVDLVQIEHVAGHEVGARAARVHVVDLRQRVQVVERVALQGLGDGQRAEFLGDLEHRVFDRHFGDVGEGDLVAPLHGGRRHHRDGHVLAYGRHAFRQRRVGERNAVPASRLVGDAAPLGQLKRIAELVNDQLTPRERQSRLCNIGFDVGLKATRLVNRHVPRPSCSRHTAAVKY